MARYYLGLDNGGSKTKASLYTTEGKEIAVAGTSANPVIRKGGFVERDSDRLWESNAKVIRQVIEKSGVDPHDIAGVAATGHGNGVYMIGEDGRPSAPGIISTDTRAADVVRRWIADGVQTRIIPMTKQTIWAGQPVAILAWFHENQPEVLDRTRWALTCKDYIRYRLTGEVYGEITDMSAISAMDLQTREYDGRILSEFGLERYRHIFPPLKLSTDICGYVTREAAEQTGLIEGTMVSGGLFDCASCCLATGVTDNDALSVIAGTWSINSFISQTPVYSEDLFMTSLFCLDGYYLTTEGSMTSAGNLEWFIGSFLTDDDGKRRDNVYEYCNSLVSSLKPEDSNVIFLPFLYGTNVNADAKACFMGIDGSQGKAHMVRAMYEGVVFSARIHIERLLRFTDIKKKVRISGGATESPLWVQMFADVLQMPIEVSDAKELGTLGAAMCVAVASGDAPDLKAAAQHMSRVRYTCQPNPDNRDIYEKKYGIYKELLKALDPVWAKWRSL
jgi:L-xylulokinase